VGNEENLYEEAKPTAMKKQSHLFFIFQNVLAQLIEKPSDLKLSEWDLRESERERERES